MQYLLSSRAAVAAISALMLFQDARAQSAQNTPAPNQAAAQNPEQNEAAKGIPPRAAPTDYQANAKAGAITIAAEFTGHSVATPDAIYSTEDYVVVEVGLYGPADARLKLSFADFSLNVNGRKMPLPAQPYGLVFASLKDPEWEPPESASKAGKTSLNTGGGGQGEPPPLPPKMPFEMKRAMQQRVQKASLPEGERPLPDAGLVYFPYRGKAQGIRSVELVYSGPAGKATLTLQP